MMRNTISRRHFLQTGAVALAASLPMQSGPNIKVYHIGLQLYSVREAMEKDPLGTLKAVTKIGYKEVEHANYRDRKFYGFPAVEFDKILKDNGLAIPSSHTVFHKAHWLEAQNDVTDAWKKTIDDALNIGQDQLISPWFEWDLTKPDEMKRGVGAYERCGEICRAAGLRFGFHNHTVEFENNYAGQPIYEYMLRNWSLTNICQQLDICNMAIGGAAPMDWLRRYPHQFESLHVKDRAPGKDESILLGTGSLAMAEILAFAKKHTPVKYWIIEQESHGRETPMEAAAYNLRRFKEYGFI